MTRQDAAAPEHINPALTGQLVAVDTLHNHPRNYNRHDRLAAIKASLTGNGQYRPITVQASTRYVVAGNGVLIAAKALGWQRIAATIVDIDDDTALRILLVDNKSSSYDWDLEQIAELLDETGLDYTGWPEDEYAQLLADLEPAPQPEPGPAGGSGGGEPEPAAESHDIVVECDGPEQQHDLLEQLTAQGLVCRPFTV